MSITLVATAADVPGQAPVPQAARQRLRHATIRGGALALSGNSLRFAITIASVAWLSRLLSPAQYGLYGIVGALVAFLGTFRDLGLSLAVTCEKDLTHEQASAAFWLNLLAGTGLMLLCWLLAPLLSLVFADRQLTGLVLCLALSLPVAASSIMHRSLLRRQLAVGRLVVIDLIALLGSTSLGIMLARHGAGVWSLVAMSLASEGVSSSLTWLSSPWRPTGWRSWRLIGGLLRPGWNLQMVSVCNMVAASFDKLMIGRACGTHSLGLYARAQSLLTLPVTQALQPVGNVVIPAFCVLLAEPAAYRRHFLAGFRLIALATGAMTAVMACSAGPIVALVLGRQWSETSAIFSLLSLGMFTNTVGQGDLLALRQPGPHGGAVQAGALGHHAGTRFGDHRVALGRAWRGVVRLGGGAADPGASAIPPGGPPAPGQESRSHGHLHALRGGDRGIGGDLLPAPASVRDHPCRIRGPAGGIRRHRPGQHDRAGARPALGAAQPGCSVRQLPLDAPQQRRTGPSGRERMSRFPPNAGMGASFPGAARRGSAQAAGGRHAT